MEEALINILCCPDHPSADLGRLEDTFLCWTCNRRYTDLKILDKTIPNFLSGGNFNPMETLSHISRPSPKNLLDFFQGRPFTYSFNPNETVLDVGCGTNPRGTINVDCYVPNPIPVNFVLADAEHLPFKDKSVDTVVSFYNIEHLVDPASFFKKAAKIARKKVIMVTDNSEWFGDIIFRVLGVGRIYNREHCYKWSKEYMENLLTRLAFKNVNVSLVNMSTSLPVKILALVFGPLPGIGDFFYRDLKVEITL
jgi:SAM-dependent methyltransferase